MCSEQWLGRKRKFCSDECCGKFWKKIENDSVRSAIPYYQNATNENGRLLKDTMKYGVRYE